MTEHFLKAGYKPYYNKGDSLEMSGGISEAYSSLLEDIWSGEFDVVSPSKFQVVINYTCACTVTIEGAIGMKLYIHISVS